MYPGESMGPTKRLAVVRWRFAGTAWMYGWKLIDVCLVYRVCFEGILESNIGREKRERERLKMMYQFLVYILYTHIRLFIYNLCNKSQKDHD